ncbi:unnamed protein product [Rhizophagus irregularis]|nr:unnamed protein product [Rhizophagus irregularis]CAB5390322.1 unnamed protein product [Rhizophagus irregularis]
MCSSTTQSHATVECGFRRVWMYEFSNLRRFFLSDLGHGFQWKFRNFLLFGFNYESNNCNFNCNNIYNIFLPILLTEFKSRWVEALSTSQTARTFWQGSVQFPELDMAMQIWT